MLPAELSYEGKKKVLPSFRFAPFFFFALLTKVHAEPSELGAFAE
jgi:hypothetical protein